MATKLAKYAIYCADWARFDRKLNASWNNTQDMTYNTQESIDRTIEVVTDCLVAAANRSIPKRRHYARDYQREWVQEQRNQNKELYRSRRKKYSQAIEKAKTDTFRKFVTQSGNVVRKAMEGEILQLWQRRWDNCQDQKMEAKQRFK